MKIRKIATAALLVLASFTTAFTAGTVTAPQASASVAASVTAHGPGWWDTRTCRDYLAWDARPSSARFGRMTQDARHADTFLAADVAAWASDVKARQSRVTLEADRGEVFGDCVTVLYGV